MQTIHDGGPVWQSAPTLSCPVPPFVDVEFACWLELRLRNQPARNIKHVHGADATGDNPLINARSRDDQDISANATHVLLAAVRQRRSSATAGERRAITKSPRLSNGKRGDWSLQRSC